MRVGLCSDYLPTRYLRASQSIYRKREININCMDSLHMQHRQNESLIAMVTVAIGIIIIPQM